MNGRANDGGYGFPVPPGYYYGYYYGYDNGVPMPHADAYRPGALMQPQVQVPYTYDPAEVTQPLTFVLVHGSWADASFWDGVAAELRRMGHTVYAPEYPGHGAIPGTNVTHGMQSEAVADFIKAHDLRDVVLVGHSFGGSVVQKAAEQVPDRLKRIVFIDGFVVGDGQSVADQFPPSAVQGFEQLRKASKDDTIMLPYLVFRDTFVNLADAETAKRRYADVRPEPAKPLFEKLDLKKFYALATPRSYVFLTGDNAVPPAEGYGWHPHMSSRLGVYRLVVGKGDHMTYFFTKPQYIAGKLYEAGRD